MVLTKRKIDTTEKYISFGNIQGNKNQTLQIVEEYNNIGIIEQLTRFFEYSNSIFQELMLDIEASSKRIQLLSGRVHNATLSISNVEQNLQMSQNGDNLITTSRFQFESDYGEKGNHFTKDSNTLSINTIYSQAQKPPALEQLDPYREDNGSCLRLYSNPNFFIESWIMAQKEKIARDKEKREERRQKRAERKKEKQLSRNNEKVVTKSVQLRRDKYKEFETNNQSPTEQTSNPQLTTQNSFVSIPPPSFNQDSFQNNFVPPPPQFNNAPPPPPQFNSNVPPPPPQFNNVPPPPQFNNVPPPPQFNSNIPPPPQFNNAPPPPQFNSNIPPPPQFNVPPPPNAPPPPSFNSTPNPPQFNNAPPPPPPGGLGDALSQIESNSGGGGGLLDMIKNGVNLKKAVKPVEKEIIPQETGGFNTNLIAQVLNQRREALEDSSEDSDDSDWD